ncbi:hypothetical protein ACHAPD_011386 [Fusarium lateritium]
MALPAAPPPKSPLGRYRLLSPTASIWVSPICLGTMNFGNSWKELMGECNQSTAESILDFYYEQLYVHWYDGSTTIPELMQSLNQLVLSGKVLHLGISDTPAWIVSKANEYARCNGLRQFSVYQGRWSASSRDFERDIIPMCRAEGMGIAPWGSLGGGKFKSEEQRNAQDGRKVEASEQEIRTSRVLESISNRKTTLITSVALAYVMHKTSYVFPIIGGRKVEHLKANIQALTLKLTQEDIQEIDSAVKFDPGFPNDFLYRKGQAIGGPDVWLLQMGGALDHVQPSKPISPVKRGE